MNAESGRNRQQPEYLNDKDAAEDRQGKAPADAEQNQRKETQDEKEERIETGIRNAFGH